MKTILTIASLYATLILSAFAQADPVPQIVIDGLEAYKKSNFEAAFDTWLKGSPLENDTTTKLAITGGIAQIEGGYGKMIGYEFIKTVVISPSVRRVYVTLLHEKGPLYAWFECYKTGQGWIIPQFDANTKAALALPATFLDSK